MKTVNFRTLVSGANRRIFRTSFLLFILIGVIITPIVAYILSDKPRKILEPMLFSEKTVVKYESLWISNKLNTLSGDTKMIADDISLKKYLATGSQEDLKNLTQHMISVSGSRKIYDQIRFIDDKGNEKLRIDYKFGSPFSVPADKLQNKSDRYYFVKAMSMKKGGVYLSPMDLNEEHGMVETPFKPMIRAAVQVYDSNNVKRGILVINYLAEDMLDNLNAISKTGAGDIMLVNKDGFWLLSNVEDDEWGFQLSERSSRKFQYDFPAEWQTMSKTPAGQMLTDNGIFTYAYQRPQNNSQHQDCEMLVIQHVPSAAVNRVVNGYIIKLILLTTVIFLLACIPAWILARIYTGKKLNNELMNIMSNYDPMTKLPNRTFFFEQLKEEIDTSVKYHKKFALLLIDFCEFKQVNKMYGIKAGDKMMSNIFDKIAAEMPEKSFLARLKSDDFAALLKGDINREFAENTIKTIIAIADTSALYGKDIKVSVNIGAAIFPQDAFEINTLMKNAESALAEARKNGPNAYAFSCDILQKSISEMMQK